MTKEEVQEKIDLTVGQEKAFQELVRAMDKCRQENIYFYQNLEFLHPLDGHNVRSVEIEGGPSVRNLTRRDPRNLQWLSYPSLETAESFADDIHFVLFK